MTQTVTTNMHGFRCMSRTLNEPWPVWHCTRHDTGETVSVATSFLPFLARALAPEAWHNVKAIVARLDPNTESDRMRLLQYLVGLSMRPRTLVELEQAARRFCQTKRIPVTLPDLFTES